MSPQMLSYMTYLSGCSQMMISSCGSKTMLLALLGKCKGN